MNLIAWIVLISISILVIVVILNADETERVLNPCEATLFIEDTFDYKGYDIFDKFRSKCLKLLTYEYKYYGLNTKSKILRKIEELERERAIGIGWSDE